jgi:hypothetical protein
VTVQERIEAVHGLVGDEAVAAAVATDLLRRPSIALITGEPDDRGTVMSGSAGGRAEKDLPVRHLAARPTRLPG